ncbi:MAG TPA: hypothetical protein VK365_09715 [Nocardioidaceae bacterium]|jgi:hypothetical protein|nr:hypothetical protein [Nocardioidaceae bacterium]
MTDLFLTVCTVVGMVTLYTVAAGSLVVWGVRLVRRRRARLAGRLAGGAPMGIDRRARSWDELPEWVSQDREWAAAVVVLGSASIAERTAGHVDFAERQVDWEGLRRTADDWDQHARTLVEVADALAHATSYGPRHDAPQPPPAPDPSDRSLTAP